MNKERQPNTRELIIAAGIYRALADAEIFVPGSESRLRHWQDLNRGIRCIAVGRVVSGKIQMWTEEDELQFQIVSDEKLCKPGFGADPDHLILEAE